MLRWHAIFRRVYKLSIPTKYKIIPRFKTKRLGKRFMWTNTPEWRLKVGNMLTARVCMQRVTNAEASTPPLPEHYTQSAKVGRRSWNFSQPSTADGHFDFISFSCVDAWAVSDHHSVLWSTVCGMMQHCELHDHFKVGKVIVYTTYCICTYNIPYIRTIWSHTVV